MKKATPALTEKSAIGSAWVVITCPETSNILLGKRAKEANNPGQWNLFGGGIEGSETAIDTALRELWEEAGIRVPADRLRRIGTAPGNLTIFALDLTPGQAKAAIHLNKLEVAKAKWFSLDGLPTNLHKSALALMHLVRSEYELFPAQVPSMRSMMDVVEGADRKSHMMKVTYAMREGKGEPDYRSWYSEAATVALAKREFKAWFDSAHIGASLGAVRAKIISVEPVPA